MNGALLLLPFFVIRFGLLALLNKSAIPRAAHFAPLQGCEKGAYVVYQISNLAIFISLFFLRTITQPPLLFCAGVTVLAAGIILLLVSVVCFATPAEGGINKNGAYRVSRNPMYLAYFFYFVGCTLLTQSLLLLGLTMLFQISAHWIILAEERWCSQTFGAEYLAYKKAVRRYF